MTTDPLSNIPEQAPSPTPLPPPAPPRSTPVAGVLGAILGGVLVLLSLCGIAGYLILPLQRVQDILTTNTLIASFTSMLLFYGTLLLVVAILTLRGKADQALRFPPFWVSVLLFAVVIAVGQIILYADVQPAYLFPPWHVLAAGLIPLAVLSYAVRRLPPVSSGSLVAQIAWGGIGTILPAMVLELVIGAVLVVIVLVLAALALGSNGLQELLIQVRPILRGGSPDALLQTIQSQPALLIIAALAAMTFLSLAVPVVEELLKSAGPAVAIWRTKSTAAQALVWGLAAGAGYAFSENMLNGAGSVNAGGAAACLWAPIMLLRGGTSLMHIATTATVSLGWYSLFVQHNRFRFFLALVAGLLAHGVWNLIALGMGAALPQASLCGAQGGAAGPSVWIGYAALVLLILLMLAATAWIVGLVRWARPVNQ